MARKRRAKKVADLFAKPKEYEYIHEFVYHPDIVKDADKKKSEEQLDRIKARNRVSVGENKQWIKLLGPKSGVLKNGTKVVMDKNGHWIVANQFDM